MKMLRPTGGPSRCLPFFVLVLLLAVCSAPPGRAEAPERRDGGLPPPGDPEGGFGYMGDSGGGWSGDYVPADGDEEAQPAPRVIGIWLPAAGIFVVPAHSGEPSWCSFPARFIAGYRNGAVFR